MRRGSRRCASVAAALAVSTLLLSACGGGGSSSDTAPTSPEPTGKLANDVELLRDFPNVDAQVAFVEQGKGVMPSFRGQLTAAHLRAVVRYEREVLSKRGG